MPQIVRRVGSSTHPLYLDHAASTPPAEEVVAAMLPWMRDLHANPHADNWHGRRAANAIEEARATIADLIGATPEGIIFTSGATEANNLALKGLLTGSKSRHHLWISEIEHKSLLEPARYLMRQGTQVHFLPSNDFGNIEPSDVADILENSEQDCGLVAVSHGNNEIGTIQPIAELCQVVHARGHLLHVDASQTAGCVPIDADDDGIDLVCLSSHKMYGPAGIGALYVSSGLEQCMVPLMHGGGQERGVRSGTISPALAVGFGTAAKIAQSRMTEFTRHQSTITQAFLGRLRHSEINFRLIGNTLNRLPGHLSLLFAGIEADDLLASIMPALSASSGAACASTEYQPSHVLRAIGLNEPETGHVIRISFGRESTWQSAINAADIISDSIKHIQQRGL